MVAVSTLKALDFRVTPVATADEAGELLKTSGEYHLVLSDIRMPGQLSGVDLAEFIKVKYPAVQVILTTGCVDGTSAITDFEVLYKTISRRGTCGQNRAPSLRRARRTDLASGI